MQLNHRLLYIICVCVCLCSKEMEYTAVVNITGILGDHVSFSVSGNGSADEATSI